VKRFFAWGNRLHSGESSIPFVGKAKLWLSIAGVLVLLSLLVPLIFGFNFGIAFKGGSQFQVDHVSDTSAAKGENIVNEVVSGSEPRLTPTSDTAIQIETNQLTDPQMQEVRDALVAGYDVKVEDVTSTFVGPEWGQDVTSKMIRALVIFVAIALIVMALYFRTWKMSVAAIVGLFVVMIVTMGIYSATGFEVTPEAIIGFLTVLELLAVRHGRGLRQDPREHRQVRGQTQSEVLRTRQPRCQSDDGAFDQHLDGLGAADRIDPVPRRVPPRCRNAGRYLAVPVHRYYSGSRFDAVRREPALRPAPVERTGGQSAGAGRA
jgi:hypothetical protein